jgi:hypothetical protein
LFRFDLRAPFGQDRSEIVDGLAVGKVRIWLRFPLRGGLSLCEGDEFEMAGARCDQQRKNGRTAYPRSSGAHG